MPSSKDVAVQCECGAELLPAMARCRECGRRARGRDSNADARQQACRRRHDERSRAVDGARPGDLAREERRQRGAQHDGKQCLECGDADDGLDDEQHGSERRVVGGGESGSGAGSDEHAGARDVDVHAA